MEFNKSLFIPGKVLQLNTSHNNNLRISSNVSLQAQDSALCPLVTTIQNINRFKLAGSVTE